MKIGIHFKNILFKINPYYRLIINTRNLIENMGNRLAKEINIINGKLDYDTLRINSFIEKKSINPEISKIISPKDQMFSGNMEHYLNVSKSAIECINNAISIANRINTVNPIKNILDLPCGHGRVLRSLKAYFPQAEITACDLDMDGVDFCVNTFNVNGVYSNTDVSKINISSKFDLIWCGSLLTHLDAEKAKVFFNFFIEKLEEKGILVLTLHGRFSRTIQKKGIKYLEDERFDKILQSYNDVGYGYDDYKDHSEYGISMLKPSWLFSFLEEKDDVTIIYYSERLWDRHQDVIALRKKSIWE